MILSGAAGLAAQLDLLNYASSLFAADSAPTGKPRVAVVYFRQEKGGGCVWPPSSTEELAATQQLLDRIMQDSAARSGVDLQVLTQRVTDVNATLEQIKQMKPDGLIAIGMDFQLDPWLALCQKRGPIPTIAYGNIVHMGRAFESLRSLPNTLLAHTPRVEWLATGVRLFRCLWDVNHLNVLDCPCEGYYEERNFHANAGVSLQVSWPVGREATILDRVSLNNDKFIVASAKVTGNNDVFPQPPCGGCRTVVEFELDWNGDLMDLDTTDLHGSAVLGDCRSSLVQFCELAGLVPVDIAGHPIRG